MEDLVSHRKNFGFCSVGNVEPLVDFRQRDDVI
jgi:hypothetical protein